MVADGARRRSAFFGFVLPNLAAPVMARFELMVFKSDGRRPAFEGS
jgi:hypothetical protein